MNAIYLVMYGRSWKVWIIVIEAGEGSPPPYI